jgi:hypothetical protein
MAEWSHDRELSFAYRSLLVEAQMRRGRHRPYARIESTDRPEEERQLDPFRTPRPALENSNLVISRWLIATVGYGLTVSRRRLTLEPTAEASLAHAAMVSGGAVFTPRDFYGRDHILTLSVGVRLRAGMPMHRMGRYGVLAAPEPGASPMRMDM